MRFFFRQMVPLLHTILERGIHFNCCKYTVKYEKKKSLKQEVSCLFPQPQNVPVLDFLFFHRPQWQISLPFRILQLIKSLPFDIPH